ncbi:bifunctional 5,10-methylenetetrahydrofolate dehydrogenase/5,10-methenyltetrahydrofolate cyclohydrolase [Candidatus Falkowbacteria bacterium]|nr:bifunctional 5,10-methylenetetrahydrofolate dehydrogenase/5,10-methenyltetrahydrofolate cyclohydrolase [Candidatus Falkowbacteria bacterium]
MIVDGAAVAETILSDIRVRVGQLSSPPVLGVALVGDDQRSVFYVGKKQQTAQEVGIDFKLFHWPATISQADLEQQITAAQQQVDGLIIQLPLPASLQTDAVLNLIQPDKDVDCLTETNWRAIAVGAPIFLPPTPAAILAILEHYHIDLPGKKIAVVGHGRLVGRPLCLILEHVYQLPVMLVRSLHDSLEQVQSADIIITGIGKPKLLKAEMVKDGAVVIDAGVSIVDGRSVGDVDFESVKDRASLISPAVGGVGPVTVAKLLENVVTAAERK